MTNNDIFKKLRVALQLRDDEIIEILELVDFRISKGEIGNFFRNEDHPKYMECGDQVLRNFLNGLVIHLRGTKEEPKDPKVFLAAKKAQFQSADKPKLKEAIKKSPATPGAKSGAKPGFKKPAKPAKPSIGKIAFKNGKKKND